MHRALFTKPDGTSETVGPMVSYQGDTTAWFSSVPGQAGNYILQFFFAGDYYPKGYYVNGIINNTATTASPTQTSTSNQAAPDNTMTIIGSGIAVIIAVAIVGALILRKR